MAMHCTRTLLALYGVILLGLTPYHVLAGDLEQRWSTQMETGQYGAQLEKLEAAGQVFYGLYLSNQYRTVKGTVLILHDSNQHPDWPVVIHPLRTGLPAFGWATLSIQLPVSNDPTANADDSHQIKESTERIHAAIHFLQSRDKRPLAIIGYGMGARMAVKALINTSQPSIESLVLISMDNPVAASSMEISSDLYRIEIPVLDIIGGYEDRSALAAARARKQNRDKMRLYRSLIIAGANHEYPRQQDVLVKRIRGWLSRTIEQMNPRQ